MGEQLAEKSYDKTVSPSVEDKLVIKMYESPIENIGGCYKNGLPY